MDCASAQICLICSHRTLRSSQSVARTAKFSTNGETLYASFDEDDLRKNVYGDKKSSPRGWKAKINTGADGNIFELVENAKREKPKEETGKKGAAHKDVKEWEYFVKTVQIDGQVYDLLANVRKKPDGEYVYSIQLNENKKKTPAPPRQYRDGTAKAENRPVRVPTDVSDSSVAESKDAVKKESVRGVKEAAEEAEALREQNEMLKKQNERLDTLNKQLQKQMTTTGAREVNRKAVKDLSRKLLRDYGSSMKLSELEGKLADVYDRLASGRMDGETWSEETRAIAQEIAENVLTQSNPLYEDMQELYRQIKGKRLKLSEDERGDVIQSGLDYNSFRKKYFGSIYLADNGQDVDSFYSELSDQYPGWFPREIYSQGEQLVKIAEVFDKLKPLQASAYSGEELDRVTSYIAGDIRESYFDIPDASVSLADQIYAREAAKYEKARERDRDYMQKQLRKERERFDRKLHEATEQFVETNRRDLNRREAADRRKSIMREAERLSKRLLRPTDTAHIPQEFRGAVLNLLEYINMESQYEWKEQPDGTYKRVKAGMGDKATARTERARELREELEALEKSGSFSIDPELNDRLKELAGYADIKLDNMTREQLDTVWNVMQAVRHAISTADTMFGNSKYRTISELTGKLKADNDWKQDAKQFTGVRKMVSDLMGLDQMAPETFLHKIGKAGDELFRQLREAADVQTVILKGAADYAQNAIKDSGLDIAALEKETNEFELESGNTLTLSTAQIMELYELMKREQAEAHIRIGGLRPGAIRKKNGETITRSKAEKVTDGDLAKILGILTPEQKALADKLQRYMSGKLAESGNEASMRVYGYQKFNEPNYWPIRVNKGEVASDPAKEAGSRTIPGFGMTKAVIPQSSNGIMLGSFFDTYLDHVSQMATYAAYLEANENATKFLNYRFVDEEGVPTGETTKTLMTKIYGDGGQRYFEKLLSDIAQGTKTGNDGSVMDKLIGNTKAAAVGANLRVILQQPTSILRAAEMLDTKYMAEGFAKSWKTGWNKALKYAPIAQWKDWGYFEIDTGRNLRSVIIGEESRTEKLRNASMELAGLADSYAWGKLWNSVEAEIKDTQPGLTGDAFNEACKERFTEVIYRTQVVDSVLNRTQIMRKSGINRMATSFMSEPSKVYNMMQRDLNEILDARERHDKPTLAAAKKHFWHTTTVLVVSSAVNAVAQAVMDAMRDDDKEKKYGEKFSKEWVANMLDSLNPATYIPYVKDIWSLVQGYDVGRMDMSAISDTVKATKKLFKAVEGEGTKSIADAGLDEALQLLKIMGIPAANVKRDIQAIVQTTLNQAELYEQQYRMDKLLLSDSSTNNSVFYADLWAAFRNDYEDYAAIYADMLRSGFEEDKIKESMEDKMKKEYGVSSVKELPVRWNDIKGSKAGAEKWKKMVDCKMKLDT